MQRGQQHEPQADAVDGDVVADAEARDPVDDRAGSASRAVIGTRSRNERRDEVDASTPSVKRAEQRRRSGAA